MLYELDHDLLVFQVFYWSHLLYVLYWVLLILHAPAFWKWFVGPCALFLLEKIFRMAKSMSEEGKTWVTMGVVLPSRYNTVDIVCIQCINQCD